MVDWQEYEARKKLLPDNLTCEEYEKAVQKIVDELEDGIYERPIKYI